MCEGKGGLSADRGTANRGTANRGRAIPRAASNDFFAPMKELLMKEPIRYKLPKSSLMDQYLTGKYGIDLRNTPEFNELLQHLHRREGRIDHFYRDQNNLVTISVGILIRTEADVLLLSRDQNLHFSWRRRRNAINRVTAQDIISDWRRVNGGGRARLRIDNNSMDYLLIKKRLDPFLSTLYLSRPYVRYLHPRVHMAIIDARFNPAGVALYGRALNRFWSALKNGRFSTAALEFERVWFGRGGRLRNRYAQRHAWRVQQLRLGLAASKRPPKVVFPEFITSPPLDK